MTERKLDDRWPRYCSPEGHRGCGRECLARRSKRHGHGQDDNMHSSHRDNEELCSEKVWEGDVRSDQSKLERRVSERVLDPKHF